LYIADQEIASSVGNRGSYLVEWCGLLEMNDGGNGYQNGELGTDIEKLCICFPQAVSLLCRCHAINPNKDRTRKDNEDFLNYIRSVYLKEDHLVNLSPQKWTIR
jgi:hypothetical protein